MVVFMLLWMVFGFRWVVCFVRYWLFFVLYGMYWLLLVFWYRLCSVVVFCGFFLLCSCCLVYCVCVFWVFVGILGWLGWLGWLGCGFCVVVFCGFRLSFRYVCWWSFVMVGWRWWCCLWCVWWRCCLWFYVGFLGWFCFVCLLEGFCCG